MTNEHGMERFFTITEIPDNKWKFGYADRVMLVGSCFAENIGEKMLQRKFLVDVNPFGVIYNPLSAAKGIKRLLDGKPYQPEDLFEHCGTWRSFDHHGRFAGNSAGEALEKINGRLEKSGAFLKEAYCLILTFGTAWVWERKETGEVAANCHKLPDALFKRYRLTPGEIVDTWRETLQTVWNVNPGLKVVFTVSPVRHMNDGVTGNQLSKATLLLAADRLVTGFGVERCAYFPAYEIMMDELRDYRFYNADLRHPAPVAVDHIWEKFGRSHITPAALDLSSAVMKIVHARMHRPLNRKSEEYRQFIAKMRKEANRLTDSFPSLNIGEEKKYFESEWMEISGESVP